MSKKRLIWIVCSIILIPSVFAASFPSSGSDLQTIYNSYSGWIDFFIIFALISMTLRIGFEMAFTDKAHPEKSLSAAFQSFYIIAGFASALSIALWMNKNNYSIIDGGPFVILGVGLLFGALIYGATKKNRTEGEKKETDILSAIIKWSLIALAVLFAFYLFYPRIFEFFPYFDRDWLLLLFVLAAILGLIYLLIKAFAGKSESGSKNSGGGRGKRDEERDDENKNDKDKKPKKEKVPSITIITQNEKENGNKSKFYEVSDKSIIIRWLIPENAGEMNNYAAQWQVINLTNNGTLVPTEIVNADDAIVKIEINKINKPAKGNEVKLKIQLTVTNKANPKLRAVEKKKILVIFEKPVEIDKSDKKRKEEESEKKQKKEIKLEILDENNRNEHKNSSSPKIFEENKTELHTALTPEQKKAKFKWIFIDEENKDKPIIEETTNENPKLNNNEILQRLTESDHLYQVECILIEKKFLRKEKEIASDNIYIRTLKLTKPNPTNPQPSSNKEGTLVLTDSISNSEYKNPNNPLEITARPVEIIANISNINDKINKYIWQGIEIDEKGKEKKKGAKFELPTRTNRLPYANLRPLKKGVLFNIICTPYLENNKPIKTRKKGFFSRAKILSDNIIIYTIQLTAPSEPASLNLTDSTGAPHNQNSPLIITKNNYKTEQIKIEKIKFTPKTISRIKRYKWKHGSDGIYIGDEEEISAKGFYNRFTLIKDTDVQKITCVALDQNDEETEISGDIWIQVIENVTPLPIKEPEIILRKEKGEPIKSNQLEITEKNISQKVLLKIINPPMNSKIVGYIWYLANKEFKTTEPYFDCGVLAGSEYPDGKYKLEAEVFVEKNGVQDKLTDSNNKVLFSNLIIRLNKEITEPPKDKPSTRLFDEATGQEFTKINEPLIIISDKGNVIAKADNLSEPMVSFLMEVRSVKDNKQMLEIGGSGSVLSNIHIDYSTILGIKGIEEGEDYFISFIPINKNNNIIDKLKAILYFRIQKTTEPPKQEINSTPILYIINKTQKKTIGTFEDGAWNISASLNDHLEFVADSNPKEDLKNYKIETKAGTIDKEDKFKKSLLDKSHTFLYIKSPAKKIIVYKFQKGQEQPKVIIVNIYVNPAVQEPPKNPEQKEPSVELIDKDTKGIYLNKNKPLIINLNSKGIITVKVSNFNKTIGEYAWYVKRANYDEMVRIPNDDRALDTISHEKIVGNTPMAWAGFGFTCELVCYPYHYLDEKIERIPIADKGDLNGILYFKILEEKKDGAQPSTPPKQEEIVLEPHPEISIIDENTGKEYKNIKFPPLMIIPIKMNIIATIEKPIPKDLKKFSWVIYDENKKPIIILPNNSEKTTYQEILNVKKLEEGRGYILVAYGVNNKMEIIKYKINIKNGKEIEDDLHGVLHFAISKNATIPLPTRTPPKPSINTQKELMPKLNLLKMLIIQEAYALNDARKAIKTNNMNALIPAVETFTKLEVGKPILDPENKLPKIEKNENVQYLIRNVLADIDKLKIQTPEDEERKKGLLAYLQDLSIYNPESEDKKKVWTSGNLIYWVLNAYKYASQDKQDLALRTLDGALIGKKGYFTKRMSIIMKLTEK